MTGFRLGPQDMLGGSAGKRWAARSNIVKAVSNPAVLHAAPDHALRIWRWAFSEVEQDRYLTLGGVEDDGAAAPIIEEVADRIVDPLNGYTHARLFCEGLNEIGRGRTAEHVRFMRRLKAALTRRGYRFAGPSAATGDYEAEDVEAWRSAGLELWTVHGYMTLRYGPTEWNAYRMRRFHRADDPPVVYSECGYDRCRDGPNGQYEPPGDGPFGWRFQFAGVPDPIPTAAAGLEAYARGLDRDWEWGATLFTTSPGPGEEWKEKGFDADVFCDRFARAYDDAGGPWRPVDAFPVPAPAPAPVPTRPPVSTPPAGGSTLTDWYPGATRRLITTNYTPGRAGRVPLLIVDHIADGHGSPWHWFDTDRGEAGSSAHFWVSRAGAVEQYRPLSDTAWANGPKCQPDLSNPVIAWLVSQGYVGMNSVTVAIEHEGKNEPLTPVQIAASRALHQWLGVACTIPLDRTHVVGHYQIDSCTRANCPGKFHPWKELLMPDATPSDINALRDQTYSLAHQLRGLKAKWQAAGYPQTAEGLDAAANAAERFVSTSKGER